MKSGGRRHCEKGERKIKCETDKDQAAQKEFHIVKRFGNALSSKALFHKSERYIK